METIRQIVHVGGDRKVEVTLPDTVQPGVIEMVIVLQPVESSYPPDQRPLNLFGFLSHLRLNRIFRGTARVFVHPSKYGQGRLPYEQ